MTRDRRAREGVESGTLGAVVQRRPGHVPSRRYLCLDDSTINSCQQSLLHTCTDRHDAPNERNRMESLRVLLRTSRCLWALWGLLDCVALQLTTLTGGTEMTSMTQQRPARGVVSWHPALSPLFLHLFWPHAHLVSIPAPVPSPQ